MKRSFVLSLAAVVCLVSAIGCGGKKLPDGMPDLYPLTVNVTYSGTPAQGVLLTFYSDQVGYGVSGKTDDAGKAIIKTQGEFPGAPAASYLVTATKYRDEESQYGKIPPLDEEEQAEWYEKVRAEDLKGHLLVSPEFTDRETTPIEIEVAPGTKTFDIDLGEETDILVDVHTHQIL